MQCVPLAEVVNVDLIEIKLQSEFTDVINICTLLM